MKIPRELNQKENPVTAVINSAAGAAHLKEGNLLIVSTYSILRWTNRLWFLTDQLLNTITKQDDPVVES